MRIQIRCEQFPVLTETFVANEARALAALGHDVEVLAHEPPDTPAAHAPGVPVRYRSGDTTAQRIRAVLTLAVRHPLGVLRDVAARPRWRREEPVPPLRLLAPTLRGIGARHVHVHFAKAAALDMLRAHRILGTPFSLTAHAYDIYAAPANLREKLDAAMVVTTGCEYTARDLPGNVHVVVMGVDPEAFRRTTPHPDNPAVLAIGRLVEKKGFVHLVRAAALVPGCELRIVGDGPLRAELAAEAQRVGANLQLLGPRDDVRPELERAALLAMPCVIAADGDRDSMPVVVKEALAMEVPVVCSDEVGLPELVRPEFGRLVAPGDHEALAAALRELLDLTPQQRAAMGAAGRAHVAEHANVLTEARRLSELLR